MPYQPTVHQKSGVRVMRPMKNSVLVVDDDPDILEALKIMLEDNGFNVETSNTGAILNFLDASQLPSIIILDVLLSGMDGRELVEKLRQKNETKDLPVVMISANPGAAKDCVERGANAFLAKPFNIDELLTIVDQYTTNNKD